MSIETPNAFGVGRLLFEAGTPVEIATLAHWANLALVAGVVLFTVWRASAVASYLAFVVASQFLSPVLWDHYAVVLLLPIAWLLERRHLWAAAVPLARAGSPEAVASAVRWLVDAELVTGQMIAVDGGQHLAWETPDIVE